MKHRIFFTVFMVLTLNSCSKNRNCPSSIKGQIIDQTTGEPIAGVKVYAQGIGETSVWGNSEYLPFDTIITNQSGEYEFSSEYNVPNWNIQVFSYDYEFVTASFWETSCENLEEDIELLEFARILVTTIDVPEIEEDSLMIYTLPIPDRRIHGEDYGFYSDIMLPGESKVLLMRPDPESLIRWWFTDEDSEREIIDIPYEVEAGEVLEFIVEM